MSAPLLSAASLEEAKALAPQAAEIIWSVDPHYNTIVFGDDKSEGLAIIEALWCLPEGSASHSNATMLIKDRQLLGLEIGAGPGRNEAKEASANRYIGQNASPALLKRLQSLQRYLGYTMVEVPPDAYYLSVIGVTPDARGQGYAGHLMNNVYARAKELGCKSIHADVYASNPVLDMYKHWGFSVLVETRIPYLAEQYELPAELRLTKAI